MSNKRKYKYTVENTKIKMTFLYRNDSTVLGLVRAQLCRSVLVGCVWVGFEVVPLSIHTKHSFLSLCAKCLSPLLCLLSRMLASDIKQNVLTVKLYVCKIKKVFKFYVIPISLPLICLNCQIN